LIKEGYWETAVCVVELKVVLGIEK
jgi:hypothetical protein